MILYVVKKVKGQHIVFVMVIEFSTNQQMYPNTKISQQQKNERRKNNKIAMKNDQIAYFKGKIEKNILV
jgi:hypothetical protein